MFDPNSLNNTDLFAAIGGLTLVIVVVALWSAVWKGIALWYAARRGEKAWYVILLILNTAGILEIIYIFAVAKRSDTVGSVPPTPPLPPASTV